MNESESTHGIGSEPESSPAEMVERLLGVAIHRRWWFLMTASIVILGSLGVLARTPNRYTSEATIIVSQQQVPERYVVPTSTTDLIKDLETMQGEVLSRTRLAGLIDEFGLYADKRRRVAPEQVLGLMLRDIKVEPLVASGTASQRDAHSFKVSFTTEDRVVAQEVTSRLASLFILNNVKGREDQAVNTTKFLKQQLDATEKQLSELEERLRDFKMQHLGELPEQQQGNLAILAGLQTQLQNTTASVARAEQQRVYLESLVNTLQAAASQASRGAANSETAPKEPGPSDEAILGAQLRLAHLQNEKKTLTSLRGPDDADVRNINVDIARTEALLQRLRAAKPAAPKVEVEDATVGQIKSQLQANQVEIENLMREEKQLKATIAQYQGRLNQTPVREQQLAGLLRDIDLARKEYAELLSKEQQSQLATSLEQQQGGQQFRLLEPPSLPTLPSSPKRVQLGLGAGAAGIVAGLLVAFLADFKYRSFYAVSEVSAHCHVPLVVGVPLFITPREKWRRRWRATGEWVAGSALTLIVCAAELVYLRGWEIFV